MKIKIYIFRSCFLIVSKIIQNLNFETAINPLTKYPHDGLLIYIKGLRRTLYINFEKQSGSSMIFGLSTLYLGKFPKFSTARSWYFSTFLFHTQCSLIFSKKQKFGTMVGSIYHFHGSSCLNEKNTQHTKNTNTRKKKEKYPVIFIPDHSTYI